MKVISRFHYITQDIAGCSHARLAESACLGGVDWVQLRVKTHEGNSYSDWIQTAMETKSVCKKFGAKLIINDHVHLAKEIEADGVHLGKEDMDPAEARKILGNNYIIGGTANTIEDIKRLMENGVDYIGLGPYRFTNTKKNLNPILGLSGIREIMAKLPGAPPVIAIGGINLADVQLLMETGIHGIAVSSAISCSEDKTAMTKKFQVILEQYKVNAG